MATVTPNALLDMRIPQFACTFKWELLNASFNVIGELHPQLVANMDMNTSASIMRAVRNVVLPETESSAINIFSDRVRPSMVLQDGTVWPMGVFYFTSDEHRVGTAHTPLSTTLMDQGFALNSPLTFVAGVPDGGSVYTAMLQIIGVTNITRFNVVNTGRAVTGGPIAWAPETTALQILSDLCARIGFFAPFFDNDGVLNLIPSNSTAVNTHSYPLENSRIVVNTLSTSTNLLTAPNAYRVISSGASQSLVASTAYIDPSLPHSRENRGFIIVDVFKTQGLGSQTECDAVALSRARQDPAQFATAEFVGVVDPRHDAFDFVDLGGVLYRETGWSVQMAPGGSHRHTLVRSVVS